MPSCVADACFQACAPGQVLLFQAHREAASCAFLLLAAQTFLYTLLIRSAARASAKCGAWSRSSTVYC